MIAALAWTLASSLWRSLSTSLNAIQLNGLKNALASLVLLPVLMTLPWRQQPQALVWLLISEGPGLPSATACISLHRGVLATRRTLTMEPCRLWSPPAVVGSPWENNFGRVRWCSVGHSLSGDRRPAATASHHPRARSPRGSTAGRADGTAGGGLRSCRCRRLAQRADQCRSDPTAECRLSTLGRFVVAVAMDAHPLATHDHAMSTTASRERRWLTALIATLLHVLGILPANCAATAAAGHCDHRAEHSTGDGASGRSPSKTDWAGRV